MVVNDAAERAVALMTEYKDVVTKNEDQKQFLLQVVELSRKTDPLIKHPNFLNGFLSFRDKSNFSQIANCRAIVK